MRLIYMAHEYGGKAKNLEAARRWLRLCNDAAAPDGDVVLAHWIAACEVYPESDAETRERQLQGDEELARRCDETWLVGPRISTGMAREMNAAMVAGRLVIAMLTPPPIAITSPIAITRFVRSARISAKPMLAGRAASWLPASWLP